jgi:hypothetical protein
MEALLLLLNVHWVSDVRQAEIHTAELLIPDPSTFEVETVTAKFKKYKWPGSHKILSELIQAECKTLKSEINKHINSICSKKELPGQWKESIIVPV